MIVTTSFADVNIESDMKLFVCIQPFWWATVLLAVLRCRAVNKGKYIGNAIDYVARQVCVGKIKYNNMSSTGLGLSVSSHRDMK